MVGMGVRYRVVVVGDRRIRVGMGISSNDSMYEFPEMRTRVCSRRSIWGCGGGGGGRWRN
jgi:hypothetical protein